MARTIRVEAKWDPEAQVWVAESPDLPLVSEAPTVEALVAKLPGVIQDLLEDENDGRDADGVFELVAHTCGRVGLRSAA